jgi:hypothetical protein
VRSVLPFALAAFVLLPAASRAADPTPGPPITIRRAAGPIQLDGDLTDAGWAGADSITTWFETRVGDNVEPQVKNLAYLTYDDKYFYAGFVFEDPNPSGIRAPLGDHDNVNSTTDYAGVIIDGRNDGKTAQMFLSNPRGVQYDAISSDVSGEDNAPDFFWESVGKVTATGWNLEIRIPFSTLRYEQSTLPTWGILLYRNYPRDRRYQFFQARLPRDVNCFICNSSKVTGLSTLPRGSHLVIAPFATAAQTAVPGGDPGTPLEWVRNEDGHEMDLQGGVDVKWSPAANITLDGTYNPDFSQVESDAAQISANERFALSFAEKRPFFLEGVDVLSTPMRAVYTRTITAPEGGVRVTGRSGRTVYTGLFTQDEGGGLVVLPGPQGSDAAFQDFRSDVGIGRVRQDLGQSYVSMLASTREVHGGGSNRVFGPDFQWRPNATETITGQYLRSETETPDRTDLAPVWDGRKLSDGAAQLSWGHSTRKVDWYLQGQDFGPDFQTWNGFIPQVGYREGYAEAGYTLRPEKQFLNRIRLFTYGWVDTDHNDNDVLSQRISIGSGMDGKLNSFIRVELNQDAIRVGDQLLRRFRPYFYFEGSPGRAFNYFSIEANTGQEIDFANAREGTGTSLTGSLTLAPNEHLEMRGLVSRRWLDVDDPALGDGRLFTAQVERLRTTWAFNSRSFVRLILQYEETRRDSSLYTFDGVDPKASRFSSSALFAYKLNWQTVLYAGYGDQRDYSPDTREIEKSGRQWFTKVSYAWQQ